MEEIKVGEYIRTTNGFIGKIENINDFRPPEARICVDFRLKDLFFTDGKNIAKHSTNIADLIEVGDWGIMNCYGLIVKKVITQEDIWELKTGNYQLLKILTKERFNSESYEV